MGVMRVDKAFHRRTQEWEQAFIQEKGRRPSQAEISRFFVHTYIPKPKKSELKLLRWVGRI